MNTSNVDSLIFDMDGTLWDAISSYCEIWRICFANHGVDLPFSDDEIKAYMHLVTGLCDLARKQKRVSAKETEVENEKYAFRCFLLRLGFIGDEFKVERKILLQNFIGSAAFKNGGKNNEVSN